MKFTKRILAVGKYTSPDGKVDVTPARLKHWAKSFKRLSAAKQVVPVRLDHGSRVDPMTQDEYLKSVGAGKTVGRVADFRLIDGGNKAEIVMELKNKKAVELANEGVVGVSPVIVEEFTDGSANQHKDVITFIDMVNYPVDYSQEDFKPVGATALGLRFGKKKSVFLMSAGSSEDDSESDDSSSDDSSSSESSPKSGTLEAVIAELAKKKIVVADDTDDSNFLDRLHTALLTANAHDEDGDGIDDEDDDDMDGDGIDDDSDPSLAAPMPTMMSSSPLYQHALQQHRKSLSASLDALVQTGRASPDEVKKLKAKVNVTKLSLGKDGKLIKSDIETFIANREELPVGAVWSNERRTRMSAGVDLVDPEHELELVNEEKRANDAADFVLKRRKG